MSKPCVYIDGKDTKVNGTVTEVASMMAGCVLSLMRAGVKQEAVEQIVLNTIMSYVLANPGTEAEEDAAAQ